MERSVRWADDGAATRLAAIARRPRRRTSSVTNPGQAQFGIVQGGVFPDLRDESADGHRRRSGSRATRSAA